MDQTSLFNYKIMAFMLIPVFSNSIMSWKWTSTFPPEIQDTLKPFFLKCASMIDVSIQETVINIKNHHIWVARTWMSNEDTVQNQYMKTWSRSGPGIYRDRYPADSRIGTLQLSSKPGVYIYIHESYLGEEQDIINASTQLKIKLEFNSSTRSKTVENWSHS